MLNVAINSYSIVMIGADEAGRGPWAGPLVVAAVRLGVAVDGLDDSKRLTAKRRTELAIRIRETAEVCVISVSAVDLDRVGLASALRQSFVAAIAGLSPMADEEIVIDGSVNYAAQWSTSRSEPKADGTVAAVSAASIIAKVARDGYMARAADLYPGYGFEKHVGYGTARHRHAIDNQGVCIEHRLSFAPLRKYAS